MPAFLCVACSRVATVSEDRVTLTLSARELSFIVAHLIDWVVDVIIFMRLIWFNCKLDMHYLRINRLSITYIYLYYKYIIFIIIYPIIPSTFRPIKKALGYKIQYLPMLYALLFNNKNIFYIYKYIIFLIIYISINIYTLISLIIRSKSLNTTTKKPTLSWNYFH